MHITVLTVLHAGRENVIHNQETGQRTHENIHLNIQLCMEMSFFYLKNCNILILTIMFEN